MILNRPVPPPPTWLALLEPARAGVEISSLFALSHLIKPRGDGHAVMVLPGFMTGDITTLALRRNIQNWDILRDVGDRALT